jgi:hypothetical protein
VWAWLKDDAGLSNSSDNLQVNSQITSALIQNSNYDRVLDKLAKSIIAMSKTPMYPEKMLFFVRTERFNVQQFVSRDFSPGIED